MTVPMVDLRAQYLRIQEAVDAAIARVVASTQFIGGEDCRLFEQEFAAFCGARHAVGVANGTDALALALRAYGVGPGDEVVTVANTFIATGEAILLNGARPVFVDVDEASFTMDPERLEAAITARTKVILPVHLYGHPAPMNEIRAVAERHGLPVLEDAAQAHGAEIAGRRAGSLGHAACFSFYPGKNLGAYGDAGMVVTSDADFAARVRQLANHGAGKARYDNVVPGTNSRLDTLQAAVLRAKLPHLEGWTAERRERAAAYARLLEGVPGLVLPREQAWGRSAWHLYTLRRREPRRSPGPPHRARDRDRGPLSAADPPAAGDGHGRRPARRPARLRAPVAGGDPGSPLSRAALREPRADRAGDPGLLRRPLR